MAVLVVAPALVDRVVRLLDEVRVSEWRGESLYLTYSEWEQAKNDPRVYAFTEERVRLCSRTLSRSIVHAAGRVVGKIRGIPITVISDEFHPAPGPLPGGCEAVKV